MSDQRLNQSGRSLTFYSRSRERQSVIRTSIHLAWTVGGGSRGTRSEPTADAVRTRKLHTEPKALNPQPPS